MALFQLQSDNPQLSFVLKKNPASGMQLRTLRKGVAFCWYSNEEQTYNVFFKDSDTEVSFKNHPDENFEYLNRTRYNSWQFVNLLSSELFSHLLSDKEISEDVNAQNEVRINACYFKDDYHMRQFANHFKDLNFDVERLAGDTYSLRISGKIVLQRLMSVVNLLAVLMVLQHDVEHLFLEDALIKKYLKLLKLTDAPYYIRYLFKLKLLGNNKRFKQHKALLEDGTNIRMAYGSTTNFRLNLALQHLSLDYPLVDIGCGELRFAKALAPKLGEQAYFAIDIDEEIQARNKLYLEKKEMDNVSLFSSLEEYLDQQTDGKKNVLITEVIEHMPMEDASLLLKKVLSDIQVNSLLITTPNADFNQFYALDPERPMRHHDHDWEMGKMEFQSWMADVIKDADLEVEWLAFGDAIEQDGEVFTPTQGVFLKGKTA